jgi:hypothetical protein
MTSLLARPRDRRVQGDAIHPCGHRGIATKRIHRAPDLNDDLLKEILPVGVLEGIRVDHFEQDPFVARQPVAEDALPLAVVHALPSPTRLGGRLEREDVRRQLDANLDAFHLEDHAAVLCEC